MTKDDFSVKIDADNQLVVSMEKKREHKDEDKKGRYLRREFSYSRFQQVMILPENVEKDKIDAKVQNGVLTIDIPKKTGSRRSEEGEGDRRQITAGGFPVPKAEKISMRKFSPLSVSAGEVAGQGRECGRPRDLCRKKLWETGGPPRKKIGRRRNNVLHFRILIINFAKRRCAFEWGAGIAA